MRISICFMLCVFGLNGAFAQTPAPNPVPKLKKVLWVWLENTPYAALNSQKYLKNVWQKYPAARFTKILPVSKVTQANVVAMITGSDQAISDNELTRLFVPSVVDLLESKNISWRVYVEDFPGSCYLGAGSGDYKRYRVPFMSVAKIQADRYLCSKVVTFRNLEEDTRFGQLPQFTVVIPNLKSSGASTSSNDADSLVKRIIDPVITSPALLDETTVVISTTNNADPKKPEMYTLIVGNGVAGPGQTVTTPYNHFHLLRTIEEGLRLGHLNQNDSKAEPMLGFWRQ